MHDLMERFKRFPKWVQIAIPVGLAAVAYYVYSKNKSSSSSSETLSEPATGDTSGESIGEPDDGGGSTSTTNPAPTPITPAPTPVTAGSETAWDKKWAAQAAANAKKLGIKDTLKAPGAGASQSAWGTYGDEAKAMAQTEASVMKKQGASPVTKTVSSKTNTVAVSHPASKQTKVTESPKVATKKSSNDTPRR